MIKKSKTSIFKISLLIFILINSLSAEVRKDYYDTGELNGIANFINGVPKGKVKTFYKNGKLRSTYYIEGRNKTNIIEYAYQNGNIYSLYINENTPAILKINNQPFNGKLILYYKGKKGSDLLFGGSFFIASSAGYNDGEIKSKGKKRLVSYWKDGKVDGLMQKYHRNGKVRFRKYFTNGYPTGKWEGYSSKGRKSSVTNYKNGKKNGLCTYYFYDTYQIESTTNYKDGKKHGREETFFINGNLLSETKFVSGKEDGIHIQYWQNGLMSNKIIMKNGKAISGTWWYENGEIGGKMTNAQFKNFNLNY